MPTSISVKGDFMVKKILLVILYTPLVLAFIYFSLCFITPITNNITLGTFAGQIRESNLPLETMIIAKEARCGKLNGNGNGMDFFACALIKSDLSLNELKHYYQTISLKPAKRGKNHSVEVDVVPAKYELESEYYEREAIYFNELKGMQDYSGYYIIILYDGGYPADFDIRGH